MNRPFTYEELCRLWGLFFIFGLDAREDDNQKMVDFYEEERKAVMNLRVLMLRGRQYKKRMFRDDR